MGTIDGIITRLTEKIEIIKSVVKLFEASTIHIDPLMTERFAHLSRQLEYDHIRSCSEYCFLEAGDPNYSLKKAEALTRFSVALTQHNYIANFDQIFSYLHAHGKQYKHIYNNHVYNRSSYKYNQTRFSLTFQEKQPDEYKCGFCGEPISLNARDSMLECGSCNASFEAKGMMLSDDRSSISEKSGKSNQYQARKHARVWIEALQGLDSKKIPDEIISYVKECARRERIIDMEMITCSRIRGYLSKYQGGSASKYNQHISKIRKLITGIEPPQLTENEMEMFCDLFSEIITIYNTIKKKSNCPYYPYFIYKIIEYMFRDDEYETRREKFFSYIHLQLEDTLAEHDKIWADICEQMPEIEFKSTVRYIN